MKIKVDLRISEEYGQAVDGARAHHVKGTIDVPEEPLVALLAAILGTAIPSNDEKEDIRIARKYLKETGFRGRRVRHDDG